MPDGYAVLMTVGIMLCCVAGTLAWVAMQISQVMSRIIEAQELITKSLRRLERER